MATSDADAKPARLPYFRLAASGRSKGVLRPRLRGAVMAWLVRPWCALALLHWCSTLSRKQRWELPALRACVWLSTTANVFISDRYHNSDRTPNPSLELELFWLRCDFSGIAAVLASTFALWSAHFDWHGRLPALCALCASCAVGVCILAFAVFERGPRRGAKAAGAEGGIKLLLAVQFLPCFGYMVQQALVSADCGAYTLIWFVYLPGVVIYVLQWPKDGELIGAHDIFHVCVVCGHLLSSFFDDMNLRDGCRITHAASTAM